MQAAARTPKSAPTTNPALATYVSQAKWAKPLAKPKVNFIPEQNWLSYNWIDRDPELAFVHQAISESGWTLEKIERETEKFGHKVSRWTLLAWTTGSTKRPQNVTMNTVMAVLGWQRPWVRS